MDIDFLYPAVMNLFGPAEVPTHSVYMRICTVVVVQVFEAYSTIHI